MRSRLNNARLGRQEQEEIRGQENYLTRGYRRADDESTVVVSSWGGTLMERVGYSNDSHAEAGPDTGEKCVGCLSGR